MPEISVIIPVYNAEKTLKQCVDSVLVQEYTNFELILVDDGSNDKSPEICDEYANKDNRIIVIHKKNGGVSSARNVALDFAKGNWITFIDSDDFISADFFVGIENSGVDIVIKRCREFECGIERECKPTISYGLFVEKKSIMSFLEGYLSSYILRGPYSKFYSRHIIGNLRFLEDMKVGEDSYFVQAYFLYVNSLLVLEGAYYIIRVGNTGAGIKYGMSVEYAKCSLSHLFKVYQSLNERFGISSRNFLSFLGYFKLVSKGEWEKHPWLWYCDTEIGQYYRFVWTYLDLPHRIIWLLASKVLKVFYRRD